MEGATRRIGPCIWFSGFSSQGDGACFEGSYCYAKGAGEAIRKYAPKDEELHRIVDDLTTVQMRNGYKLEARLKHVGPYHHEHSVQIDVFKDGDDASDKAREAVRDALRDLMRWVYRQLKEEHDYLNSDESVDENIRANEYDFTEDGNRY